MYEYLKNLGSGINARYLTVMRNVRSASNSFYDSYLDLLEETIKSIADHFEFEYDANITCGHLVKKPEMKDILTGKVGVDEYTYGKFSDYSQKINKHKHHLEKNVSVDAVINYMKVFDALISKYAKCLDEDDADPLDIDFLIEQFGKAEKENRELKEEANALREELIAAANDKQLSEANIAKLRGIISQKSKDNEDLEVENLNLTKEISKLKDIKLNSLETKLDKSIDMLNQLQDYLVESRAATSIVVKLINGQTLSDEDLKAERERMEKINNERKQKRD